MGYQNVRIADFDSGDHGKVEPAKPAGTACLPSPGDLLEATSDCVALLDASWRFTYLNGRAFSEIADGRNLLGLSLWDAFPGAIGTPFESNYRKTMETGEAVTFNTHFPPLNAWYEVQAHPLSAGGIGIWFRNVTSQREREAQMSNIFKQALVGIMECGPDGCARWVNARFCEILGRTAEQLQGLSVADYTHPDDLVWNLPLLQEHRLSGEPMQVEKRYLRPDGSVAWCRASISFVMGPNAEIESTIVVAEDVTERKTAEIALREGERLYRGVMEASTDCIKIMDLSGRLELMNTPGLQALEIDDFATIAGKSWLSLWPLESRSAVATALHEARSGTASRFNAYCPTARQTPRWWDVVVSPMYDDQGQVTRLLSISRDITMQRASAAHLKWTSEHDALTGLPNRRAFEAQLQAATIRAMQRGRNLGLLLLDLDHFKHVNDTMGHQAGDHLLTVFARRLQESVRESDFVARLGGDEFAIVFETSNEAIDLKAAGKSILARLQEPVRFEGRVISAGASMGGALFPADADNAHELFKNADIALYALKQSGRGGTRMFHQHMRDQAHLVSSQLSLARTAITSESVEPHYQQKLDLGTGKIIGFEALLRWRHAHRGLQMPDTVAEAFKDYELASKIGDLMQRKVFRDVRGWIDQGLPVGFVAVNAAPAEFLRDDFAERLLERMQEHAIPPSLVEIEVTEHVFFERGSDFVARALKMLARQGVRIALDDFGTGYSSLSHLRDFPVHVVKIDRSFVDRITTDPEIHAIVCAVIDLAKSLQIEVVAEGIETREQRDLLVKDGCQLGQGYLFGRAVHADEVSFLLAGKIRRLVS